MARRWQCWVYYIPGGNSGVFLYGFMAQTSLPIYKPYIERSLDNAIVQACFSVTDEQFADIKKQLQEGRLDFSAFPKAIQDLPQLVIRANCSEIRECLECTNARVLSWHTLHCIADVSDDKDLQLGYLTTLTKEVGLDFQRQYAGLIGAFEIYDLPKWSEDAEPPFSMIPREREKRMVPEPRQEIIFTRRTDLAKERQFLSVKLYSQNYLIYNRLHILEPEELQVSIAVDEHFDRESYILYDHGGNLIHSEDFPFFDAFGYGISLAGPTVQISGDRISRQAGGMGKDISLQASIVRTKSPSDDSVVIVSNANTLRGHLNSQRVYASELHKGERSSAFFESSARISIESLLHIAQLMNDASIKSAIIADPFFDKTAFEDLIPRISTRGLPVTILTNLIPREDEPSGAEIDYWAELCSRLEKNKRLIHCSLSMYNVRLRDDIKTRAFHDRYLVLQRDENVADTYLLSNSLNSRSRNFPFCMAKVDEVTSRQICNYLQSMLETPSTIFDINQVWKNHE